jgi:hypothetical protein
MRVGGWAALLTGSLMLLGLLALALMFQAMSEGFHGASRFHLFGRLSDLAPIATLLPLLVLAAVLFLLEWKSGLGLSIAALLCGVAGFVVAVVVNALFINEKIDLEQQVEYWFMTWGAVGVWLLLVSLLARREHLLPSQVTVAGLVIGGAHIVSFMAVMLLVALGLFRWPNMGDILSDPLFLTVAAVGIVPMAIA